MDFKVGLEEFRHLMRLELLREEPRITALHTVIEEIVAYTCWILEMGATGEEIMRTQYISSTYMVELDAFYGCQ